MLTPLHLEKPLKHASIPFPGLLLSWGVGWTYVRALPCSLSFRGCTSTIEGKEYGQRPKQASHTLCVLTEICCMTPRPLQQPGGLLRLFEVMKERRYSLQLLFNARNKLLRNPKDPFSAKSGTLPLSLPMAQHQLPHHPADLHCQYACIRPIKLNLASGHNNAWVGLKRSSEPFEGQRQVVSNNKSRHAQIA
jgi:hypothetical protein